jgi:hypothetical protein
MTSIVGYTVGYLLLNGTAFARLSGQNPSGTTMEISGADVVQCAVGDKISLGASVATSGNASGGLSSSAPITCLTVTRIA